MKRLAPALLAAIVGLGCEAGLISPRGGDNTPVGTLQPPGGSAPGDDGGATAVGDGGGTGGAAGTAASGLPCNVQNLLQTRCQSCHSNPPKNGAPFALV